MRLSVYLCICVYVYVEGRGPAATLYAYVDANLEAYWLLQSTTRWSVAAWAARLSIPPPTQTHSHKERERERQIHTHSPHTQTHIHTHTHTHIDTYTHASRTLLTLTCAMHSPGECFRLGLRLDWLGGFIAFASGLTVAIAKGSIDPGTKSSARAICAAGRLNERACGRECGCVRTHTY
jgi:hypothetical protein